MRIMNIFIIQKAFTLAEVLITLLVIGIVAAVTIPNLINDTQNQEYKVACKAAYSKLNQAIIQIKQDNGGTLIKFHGVRDSLKPELMNYFNIIKDCGSEDCVLGSYTSNIYKSYHGDPADTAQVGSDGQFVTSDGMFINIQNSQFFYNIYIIVDVNGYEKGPNKYAVDTFCFELINDTLKPMGAATTRFSESSYCNKNNSNVNQGLGCTSKVVKNIDY